MDLPRELIEKILMRDYVLLIGNGISFNENQPASIPSLNELSNMLARSLNLSDKNLGFARTAEYFEFSRGRHALIEFIVNLYNAENFIPNTNHENIVKLPPSFIITTNIDCQLEKAFESQGIPYARVQRYEEIPFADSNSHILLKLYGSIDKPETLVLTEDDRLNFFQTLNSISDLAKYYLVTKTLLILGYSLQDSSFIDLYGTFRNQSPAYRRKAFAVQSNLSDHTKNLWEQEERVEIIDSDISHFLKNVLDDIEHVRQEKKRAQAIEVQKSEEKYYKRPLSVFLCHSSHDKTKVRELYRKLKSDNIDPWLDEEKLLPGQDWNLEITRSLRESDLVIVCLSDNSITKSGYVQKEIKIALDIADEQPEGTIFIIPLKLVECNIPERLSKWHWVNYFEENGYRRLILALEARARALSLIQR